MTDPDEQSRAVARAAREYGDLAVGLSLSIAGALPVASDPVLAPAVEAIGRLGSMIAVSARCAAAGPLQTGAGDPVAVANFARTALELIAQSREAWEVLTMPGRAVADGAPAAMLARLDALDAALGAVAADAMAFTQPGLDE